MNIGLTYDDVLLVPQRSSIRTRKDVKCATKLTKKIALATPIVSANMDTVTESEMAITLATCGGIGIIHRFFSIEDQVKEVARVKRYENYIVEDPLTVSISANISQVMAGMEERGVTSVLVVDAVNRLEGIITARDSMFETDMEKKVTQIMTPVNRLITAKPSISLNKAKELLHEHRLEKLPLVDQKGRLCGLITARDIMKTFSHPSATKDKKGRLMVGAAVGVRPDWLSRAGKLIDAGCDVLVLDIAHGHADHAIEVVKGIKKAFPNVEMIAGNVATASGTHDLIEAGADAIKVGIGPGSMCTTRIVAGSGVPQLTAVMECAAIARKKSIPVIADGGIRYPGDVAKAIAAGASTVMVGGLFAGTMQSPGITVMRNGKKYKVSRGMASVGANMTRINEQEIEEYVAEGVEAFVPFRGDVKEMIHQLVGGLRSAMSYAGARNIEEFWVKKEFIQITQAGLTESFPHDVEVM